ncbi:beta-1 3-galactosyltransferase brn [Clonorchis sinensis]|nr:beta-1 3-galactosyltransferase brn [Clonorchis sinensis]
MGVIHQLSSSLCASKLALSLFVLSLLFQLIVFLIHVFPQRSVSSGFTEIPFIYFSRSRINSSAISNLLEPSPAFTYSLSSGQSNQSLEPNSLLAKAHARLVVNPIESTGSEELKFPLNIDMPEVVRRGFHNLPVSHKPINDPQFKVLISNKNKCMDVETEYGGPVELLILIKSAPDHFIQRDTIRLTWGKEYCWGGRRVVRLFLLGTVSTTNRTLSDRLTNEAEFYSDIIQQDFHDHYYNNTYKIMFGIDWAVQFCSNASLLMFVDDDFFVYPRNVVAYMEGLSEGLLQRLIAGYVWRNARPFRGSKFKSKWWISRTEYPNEEYPVYVAAGNFFLSMQMAREFHIASRYTRYLRFDDVFLGILLRKLLRVPIHLSQIYAYVPVNVSSKAQLKTMLSSHQYSRPSDVFAQWDRLKCDTFCV